MRPLSRIPYTARWLENQAKKSSEASSTEGMNTAQSGFKTDFTILTKANFRIINNGCVPLEETILEEVGKVFDPKSLKVKRLVKKARVENN